MSNRHLLMVSVGPVQDFIAAARKLRDLWFGSHLLSEVSKAIARTLMEAGCEMVFPSVTADHADLLNPESDFTVVNRILCVVPSGAECEELVASARQAMRQQIGRYAEGAISKARKVGVQFDPGATREQVADIGEFYAAWTPLGDSYGESRGEAEELLAARKCLRDFAAPTWDGAGRRKSSLDGARESVLHDPHQEIRGLLKAGERLDALGLIKRFYPLNRAETPHFDDLADVAAVPYLDQIGDNEEANQLLGELDAALAGTPLCRRGKTRRHGKRPGLRIYSHVLYEDAGTLAESLEDSPPQLHRATTALRELHKTVGGPAPYAAILVGDGDHMGATIDRIGSQAGHQHFGLELSRFSLAAGGIVRAHGGSLIYSGGDDVMAYLPLTSLLACATEIRECFVEAMKGATGGATLPRGATPSFSIGVAIVHFAAPLGKALSLAREAESIAKEAGGRNALAIVQSKRSGAPRVVCGKWGTIDTALTQLQGLVTEGALPGTLAYQLRDIAKRCGPELDVAPDGTPRNACAACARRRLQAKELSEPAARQLDLLLAGETDLSALADKIIIARQLAQANVPAADGVDQREEG